MAELTKFTWSECHSPGSVKPGARLQMGPAVSGWAEDIDKAQARAVYFIMLFRVLLGVGDVHVGADGLHVEGSQIAPIHLVTFDLCPIVPPHPAQGLLHLVHA